MAGLEGQAPAQQDPVALGAEWLRGQLVSCNPEAVGSLVQAARNFYGDQIFGRILYQSGVELGQAHQIITHGCMNWSLALQHSGRNQQTLAAEMQAYAQVAQATTVPPLVTQSAIPSPAPGTPTPQQ